MIDYIKTVLEFLPSCMKGEEKTATRETVFVVNEKNTTKARKKVSYVLLQH